MSNKVTSCPFCGGEVHTQKLDCKRELYYLRCDDCHTSIIADEFGRWLISWDTNLKR